MNPDRLSCCFNPGEHIRLQRVEDHPLSHSTDRHSGLDSHLEFTLRDKRLRLRQHFRLRLEGGDDLVNSTNAKIRSVMSVLFNHAIRYEWLEQGRNPITFVRQSAMRRVTPAVLEPHEIQRLLSELEQPFRLMVLLDVYRIATE